MYKLIHVARVGKRSEGLWHFRLPQLTAVERAQGYKRLILLRFPNVWNIAKCVISYLIVLIPEAFCHNLKSVRWLLHDFSESESKYCQCAPKILMSARLLPSICRDKCVTALKLIMKDKRKREKREWDKRERGWRITECMFYSLIFSQ